MTVLEQHFPTKGWRTSTPEAQGLDSSALAALDAEFSLRQHGFVNSMLVVKNGYLVFERSYAHDTSPLSEGRGGLFDYHDPDWHPWYGTTDLHTLQSVTKSVTSALIGIAIQRGALPGVDLKLAPFFEEFPLPDSDRRRAAITLRDALTMTTGIKWDESGSYTDPTNLCAAMEQSADWVQFVLNQPMAEEPGKTFFYNSGATILLSHIIHKATGMQADEFAAKHLFKPFGIERYFWKRTPTGLADTECGLYLTPRDLAKIGLLYLRDGIWDEQRILPEGWVAESTSPLFSTESDGMPDRRYGYSWWLLPHSSARESWVIGAIGYGEQRLLILPDEDLLAVFTGWNIDLPGLNSQQLLERLLNAIGD